MFVVAAKTAIEAEECSRTPPPLPPRGAANQRSRSQDSALVSRHQRGVQQSRGPSSMTAYPRKEASTKMKRSTSKRLGDVPTSRDSSTRALTILPSRVTSAARDDLVLGDRAPALRRQHDVQQEGDHVLRVHEAGLVRHPWMRGSSAPGWSLEFSVTTVSSGARELAVAPALHGGAVDDRSIPGLHPLDRLDRSDQRGRGASGNRRRRDDDVDAGARRCAISSCCRR